MAGQDELGRLGESRESYKGSETSLVLAWKERP